MTTTIPTTATTTSTTTRRRVALALLALPLWAGAADPAKLRVGVEGAYPPFSSVAPDGKLVGFDIDIANAVCAQMKVECTLVQQDFDGMIPALQARKIDLIVASMSITPERQKAVDFSDKYYQTPARLIAKSGVAIDGAPAGFKGKRIGVQRSTIHDRYASAKFAGATIARYTKQDEVFLDLASGRLDATLVDSVAGDSGFLKTPAGKGYAFTGPVYDDPAFFGVGAGIALRKGETELRARLNDAIKALRASGAYKKLQDKYFDFDVYGK
jgi:arginine/ornithine transport system substrate-binding protein